MDGYKESFLIYKSSILPYMDLGCVYYINCESSRLNALQTLQNKALRMIIGKKEWIDTEAAHSRCNRLQLTNRRNLYKPL